MLLIHFTYKSILVIKYQTLVKFLLTHHSTHTHPASIPVACVATNCKRDIHSHLGLGLAGRILVATMVRRWLGLVTLCSAAAVQIVSSQKYNEDTTADQFSRRLEVATVNSDEYAESVLTVKQTDTPKYGIGANVYTKLSSVLSMTMEMIETAKLLLQNERTLKEGTKMMEHANTMFREVMDRIQQIKADGDSESTNSLLRKKYSDEDIIKMEEDGRRALELSRQLYATVRLGSSFFLIVKPKPLSSLLMLCISKLFYR